MYKGHKYLSIFSPEERQGIASKFGENPDLSKEEIIVQRFWNTRFKFEVYTNSTNKATYSTSNSAWLKIKQILSEHKPGRTSTRRSQTYLPLNLIAIYHRLKITHTRYFVYYCLHYFKGRLSEHNIILRNPLIDYEMCVISRRQ